MASIGELPEAVNGLIKEVLYGCLERLTTQRLKVFYEKIYCYMEDAENSDLFCQHENAEWVIREICHVFEYFVIPKLTEVSSDERWSEYNKHMLIKQAYTEIVKRLFMHLSCFTTGLDDDFITALSGTAYESEDINGQSIVLIPSPKSLDGKEKVVFFQKQEQLELGYQNVEAVRKQINMAHKSALAIYKDFDSGKFFTAGLIPDCIKNNYPHFQFTRRMHWKFFVPTVGAGDGCRLQYCKGTLMMPEVDLKPEIRHLLHERYGTEVEEIVLQSIKSDKGIVIILAEEDIIKGEVQKSVEEGGCGYIMNKPFSLLKDTSCFEQFTSIDGALLMDYSMSCYAYGVILYADMCCKGTHTRGSRYNSTKNYIKKLREKYDKKMVGRPPLGIVKSEDGMLDLFDGDCGKCKQKDCKFQDKNIKIT